MSSSVQEASPGTLKLACVDTVTLTSLDLDKIGYAYLTNGSSASILPGAIDVFGATGASTQAENYQTDPLPPGVLTMVLPYRSNK